MLQKALKIHQPSVGNRICFIRGLAYTPIKLYSAMKILLPLTGKEAHVSIVKDTSCHFMAIVLAHGNV